MSDTYHHGERRIRVRAIRRKQPDLRRLGRALIELALEQARAEAEAEQERAAQLGKQAKRRKRCKDGR